MKDYSSMTIQERIEDMFAYLAVCRQMEAMLPERIEILEMGLRALEEKIGNSHKEEKRDERWQPRNISGFYHWKWLSSESGTQPEHGHRMGVTDVLVRPGAASSD